jgi:two-component system sensor histidine kinase ResE
MKSKKLKFKKFRHSLFFRLLLMFVSMSVMALAFTFLVFLPEGRSFITTQKQNEAYPVIESMSNLIESYLDGTISQENLLRYLSSQPIPKNSQLLISDQGSNIIFASRAINSHVDPNNDPTSNLDYTNKVEALLNQVLQGSEISKMVKVEGLNFESLFVGQPIVVNNEVVGAVALVVPNFEINTSLYVLAKSLIWSMLLAMALMTFVVYAFSKRFTKPIDKMITVASKMREGDFTLRADIKDQSELGDLGRSLNQLSADLSETINKVTIEKNRLMLMLSGMNEGIVFVNTQSEVLLVNPAFYRLFKLQQDSDISSALIDLKLMDGFTKALDGKTFTMILKQESQAFNVVIQAIQDETQSIVGALAILTDITESEKLEQLRKDYVANVSHELRTPLTAIRALIEPLNDDLVTEESKVKEYYGLILKESGRLNRLINDLLELSRLQNSEEGFELHPLDLGALMKDIKERYQALADKQAVTLELSGDQALKPILTNEDRIEQVITILIDNAFKFTPKDGSGRISLQIEAFTDKTLITVSDNGQGIRPEDLPHVFDRFYTADRARTGKATGLGLSIAKEILKRMNGDITATSEEGKGSRFTITLNHL